MSRRSGTIDARAATTAETANGSQVDGEWLRLGRGLIVSIRPLSTGDEDAIASWFAGLGTETRYARFLGHLKRLDRRLRSALASVDHVDHEAIVARSFDGEVVGIARYIRLGASRSAEVAIAVADDWRGNGIATVLLDRIAARARTVGIERLTATCLSTNEPVIRLLSRLGETTVGPSLVGLVDVTINLSPARRDQRSRTGEPRSLPERA